MELIAHLCSRNTPPHYRKRIWLKLRLSTDQSGLASFRLSLNLSLGPLMKRVQWKIHQALPV